jgi:hypothetical protein
LLPPSLWFFQKYLYPRSPYLELLY